MAAKISGFTFIKNGLTLGYPILESVQSIDPICDEVVINVGFDDVDKTKDDGTYQYLRDHLKGDKYKFVTSWWDPSITKSGLISSVSSKNQSSKREARKCKFLSNMTVFGLLYYCLKNRFKITDG